MSEIRIPRPRLVARPAKRMHILQLSPSQNVEAMLDESAEKSVAAATLLGLESDMTRVREARQKILNLIVDPMRVSKISVGKLIALSMAAYMVLPAVAVATSLTSALNTRLRNFKLPFPLLWVALVECSLVISTIIFFKATIFLVPAAFTGYHLWCCAQLLATRWTKQFSPICFQTLTSLENRVEKTSNLVRISFLNLVEATLKSFEPTDLDLRCIEQPHDQSACHKTPLLVPNAKVAHAVEDRVVLPIRQKHKMTMEEPTPLTPVKNPLDFDQDSWLLVPGPRFQV